MLLPIEMWTRNRTRTYSLLSLVVSLTCFLRTEPDNPSMSQRKPTMRSLDCTMREPAIDLLAAPMFPGLLIMFWSRHQPRLVVRASSEACLQRWPVSTRVSRSSSSCLASARLADRAEQDCLAVRNMLSSSEAIFILSVVPVALSPCSRVPRCLPIHFPSRQSSSLCPSTAPATNWLFVATMSSRTVHGSRSRTRKTN